MAAFRKAAAAGDFVTAKRVAHTLKGVAATLGADDVHAAALQLDGAMRDGANDMRQLEPLVCAVEEASAILNRQLCERLPAQADPAVALG